jgi:hypothetical protein
VAGVQFDSVIKGATTSVDETAYTNSFVNATVATQYTLSALDDRLFIQNPSNTGTQILPLELGTD